MLRHEILEMQLTNRSKRARTADLISLRVIVKALRSICRRWPQRGVKSATFGSHYLPDIRRCSHGLSSTVVKNMIGTTGLRSRRPSDALSCPYLFVLQTGLGFQQP